MLVSTTAVTLTVLFRLVSQGKVIAVCTEAAQQTSTGQVRLNYAPVVDALADWLHERGSDLWVDPVVLERPQEPAKKP